MVVRRTTAVVPMARNEGPRRRLISVLLAGLSLGGLAGNPARSETATSTYWNAKWRFSITYPTDVFNRWQDLPNGDGRRFVAEDGSRFVVSGGRNELGASARALMKLAAGYYQQAGASITYQRTKNDWYVLSGYEGRWIYYERAWVGSDGSYDVLLIRFRADKRSFYYDPVEHMSWSFRRVR
jgi:hypothetical protein